MANLIVDFKKNTAKGVWILPVVLISILAGILSIFVNTGTVLLLTAGFLLMVFFLNRPFQILLVFVFLIPSELLLIATPGASILRYLGIEVALIWFINLIVKPHPIFFRRQSLLYFSYFALSCLSLFWAPIPKIAYQFAITNLQLSLLLFIMLDQVSSLTRLKQVITALAAGGILEIAIFLLFGNFSQMGRFAPVSLGGTGLAPYVYPLAFSITILGILGILGKGKIRIIGIIGYIVGLFPLIGAGLRGALMAMAIGIGVSAFVIAGKKKSAVFGMVIVILLLIGGINYLSEAGILPVELINHLTIENAISTGGSNRLAIWKSVLLVAKQNPFFGLGLKQYSIYAYQNNFYNEIVGVHNDYLNTLVDLGGVGALILVSGELLTIFLLLKTFQFVKKQDLFWYGVLVGLIFASIVGQNFVDQIIFKYVWVIRAIVIAGSYPYIWTGEIRVNQQIRNRIKYNLKKFKFSIVTT